MNVDKDLFSTMLFKNGSDEPTNTPIRQAELRHSASAPVSAGKNSLPRDYVPGNYDVICGKGKECFNSIGNRRFRIIADLHLEKYSLATRKSAKSHIVSEVVHTIHGAGGRFIKKEKGSWVEISDSAAREKAGALFRDSLHFQYRSSGKAKTARRQQQRRSGTEQHCSAPVVPSSNIKTSQEPAWENHLKDSIVENVSELLSDRIHDNGIGDDEYVKHDLIETNPDYHEVGQGKRRKVQDVHSTNQLPRRSFGLSVLFNELQVIHV